MSRNLAPLLVEGALTERRFSGIILGTLAGISGKSPRDAYRAKLFGISFAGGRGGGVSWKKNLQGLNSWVWLPKFCRTFGVLYEGFSTGFLLCETSCRTPKVLQNSGNLRCFQGSAGRIHHVMQSCSAKDARNHLIT